VAISSAGDNILFKQTTWELRFQNSHMLNDSTGVNESSNYTVLGEICPVLGNREALIWGLKSMARTRRCPM